MGVGKWVSEYIVIPVLLPPHLCTLSDEEKMLEQVIRDTEQIALEEEEGAGEGMEGEGEEGEEEGERGGTAAEPGSLAAILDGLLLR